MLQEADIGVGISGVEGMQVIAVKHFVSRCLTSVMSQVYILTLSWYQVCLINFSCSKFQAVMSSDIAIAQFRFLERLLLVHGHWCYRRISSMVCFTLKMLIDKLGWLSSLLKLLIYFFVFWQICYFFYKNIAFGFTLFFFEAYASFSGQPVYNDWFLSLYNVFFTSLPVIALGVFDQDVSARFCLKVGTKFLSFLLTIDKNLMVALIKTSYKSLKHSLFIYKSYRKWKFAFPFVTVPSVIPRRCTEYPV